MTSPLRHLRGLGIAIAVLAISAGAVFAAAPSMRPVSHATGPSQADPTTEPTETAEPTETPEPTDSPDPTATPGTTTTTPTTPTASPNAHGVLVSTAAQMTTPVGFANHGAFVSCVARSTTIMLADLATLTPGDCGLTPVQPTAGTSGATTHGNSANHGAAGRAKGQANRAAHGPTH